MDWSKEHTLTIKKGFITSAFGIVEEDQTFEWNTENSKWELVSEDSSTVDPNAHLKDDSQLKKEQGCGGNIYVTIAPISFIMLICLAWVMLRRKKNA